MESKNRILVVDDEQEITLVLRSGLAKHGYEVRVAGEGEAALELFQAWTPDLVVTDLSMPNMNGLKLCQRLREVSAVPIIVLSVKSDETTKVEALDSGADDYVTKPFGMGELLARVRAALRRSPEASEEATSIEEGDFRIDLETRQVKIAGKEIRLSPKGIRPAPLFHSKLWQGPNTPHIARKHLGWKIYRPNRIPSSFRTSLTQED